ncbi:NADP-dependent oxidoreductase [Nocardia sp. BMG111209]|uniref:NADP-dependent oxidoreductase n=1 Tax=Nocardia sp. BMG111209 TaxID=1160137 RepID=UPI000366A48F|nr:NADP-dependent oxidoreductase [Nocardia sp. BMG111209]
MARAVRFDRYGDVDVLNVVEVPDPVPGPGQVVVEVVAAAINPGEAKIRAGLLHDYFPATFPSGQGSDFAGRVAAVGPGVGGLDPGAEVIGFTDERASQATHVVVPFEQLTPKPAALSWEEAGSLYVAGTTAFATVRAVSAGPGDVVAVSGAAGGVGSIAVQLLRERGATVIAIAGPANHDRLRGYGATPVAYGDGLAERLPHLDAFIDTHGDGYVELAVRLGVAPERIDTIADFAAVEKYHVRSDGNGAAGTIDVVAALADLVAAGTLQIPIVAVYPLDLVRDAYRDLEHGHTPGKIVLRP